MDILTVLQQVFIEPISFPFMQRAFLAVMLIGGVSGIMGAYVVTRGMAFLGDALAHTILPGVAMAYLATNGNANWVFAGGLISGVASALVMGAIARGKTLSEDTAIGVVFAGALALGIGIISLANNYTTDLAHLLIGNVLAVRSDDLILIVIVSAVVLIAVRLFYKEFLILSFDPGLADVLRLPGGILGMVLLVLLALTVVIALQAVGVAMVAAMLVTPAATARFFTRRLHQMMAVGAGIGAVGGAIGLYFSWHLSVAPSAAIVLTYTALFALTFLFRRRRK